MEICCSWWGGWIQSFSSLTVDGNNRASMVLQSFIAAVDQYGLPSRVLSDKGGENTDVAELMTRSRGTCRNSHITGRSVHNQQQINVLPLGSYNKHTSLNTSLSYVTHKSTQCQLYPKPRIERMWRDVYEHALDLFYQIITSLENQGTLNPDNKVHLFALHRSFLPII